MADSLSPSVNDDGANDGQLDTSEADPLVIQGTVRDSLGVALPRAVVTLAEEGGRPLAKTRSAVDGGFEVCAPALGEFLLTASSPQLGRQSVAARLDGRPVRVEFRIDVPGTVAE